MNKRCKAILNAFKEANPDLVALSPKIVVDEMYEKSTTSKDFYENIVYDPPVPQITVTHNFIFDNRLVPTEFQGIEVRNIIVGQFPAEFPEPLTLIRNEEYYSAERYIKFVKRSMSRIRKKLKKPDLSEEEALDALTFDGDFKKHVDWCNAFKKRVS